MTTTHLVELGADRTRCGLRLNGRDGNPYPYVAAEHAWLHIKGRAMDVCKDCIR